MGILLTLVWLAAGAVAGWAVASARAATAASRRREQMIREIRSWQAETERYKSVADRLAQDKKSWAEGCKQGRDDVITIVPLLMAAQQRLLTQGRTSESATIDDCL
jgi:hypothetical protein